jgi:hypothetical protein
MAETTPSSPVSLQTKPNTVDPFINQSMVPPPLPIAYVPVPSDATANATTECLEWYTTDDNDACGTICQDYNIPYWALQEWNPALGPSAPYGGKLVVLCLRPRRRGHVLRRDSTTTASGGPPGPTQTGIVAGCTEWYVSQTNDEYGWIAGNYSISLAQFYAWNPAMGDS